MVAWRARWEPALWNGKGRKAGEERTSSCSDDLDSGQLRKEGAPGAVLRILQCSDGVSILPGR